MAAVVQLSVGGSRFESTRSTLCRVPGSFFDVLLGESGGASFAPPADGVYRIDRSPAAFAHVLEYLRNGLADMNLPDAALASAEAMAAVGREASFFLLPELETFVVRLCLLKRWSGMLPRDLLYAGAEWRVELWSLDGGAGGESQRLVDVEVLRSFFPALAAAVERENARGGDFGGGGGGRTRTTTSYVKPPRADCLRAVLSFARLAGSAAESWALPQPAAHMLGFCFVSPQRLEVQRLFDGAEEARLWAVEGTGDGESSGGGWRE